MGALHKWNGKVVGSSLEHEHIFTSMLQHGTHFTFWCFILSRLFSDIAFSRSCLFEKRFQITNQPKSWKQSTSLPQKNPQQKYNQKKPADTEPQTLMNHFWPNTEFYCFSYFFFFFLITSFSDTGSWLWSALLDKYLVSIESSIFYEILSFSCINSSKKCITFKFKNLMPFSP